MSSVVPLVLICSGQFIARCKHTACRPYLAQRPPSCNDRQQFRIRGQLTGTHEANRCCALLMTFLCRLCGLLQLSYVAETGDIPPFGRLKIIPVFSSNVSGTNKSGSRYQAVYELYSGINRTKTF